MINHIQLNQQVNLLINRIYINLFPLYNLLYNIDPKFKSNFILFIFYLDYFILLLLI